MATFLEIAAEKPRGLNWTVMNKATHAGVQKGNATNIPLPYMDNEFDGIYSEHFIEHMYKYQGINFLKDAKRILKPGGVIRTVWPPYEFVQKLVSNKELTDDEQTFVEQYHTFYVVKHNFAPKGNSHRSKREQCALGLLHQNGEHLYIWSKKELIKTLEAIGFKHVKERKYGESPTVTEFRNIETPGLIRAIHSCVVEATSPW
mgnify:CR=1 FL=1|tara:strand:- start:358 stop:966 length:609 start_codon:yes stop_codon:yes gene_type:complete